MRAFVDSSAWYASIDDDDRHHERAAHLLSTLTDPVFTDHVVVETWLLAHRRLARAAADRFWALAVAPADSVEIVTAADLAAAWRIRQDFPYQTFSLVDCTSFAVMERLGVRRVATFDADFAVYRFGPGRSRAFDVLR